MLTHSHIKLSQVCLMVMDECHHAQSVKSHPYTQIMKDYYHVNKSNGSSLPKILGLTACLMVKSVPLHKFQEEKRILEEIMDSRVETTEDLYEILKYVTNPDEEVVNYIKTQSQNEIQMIISQILETGIGQLADLYQAEKTQLGVVNTDINSKATAKQDLERHYKQMKNEILSCINIGINEVGLIALVLTYPNFKTIVRKLEDSARNAHYNFALRSRMITIVGECFQQLDEIVPRINYQHTVASLRKLTSTKVLKLVEILKRKDLTATENRTIVFVETKFRYPPSTFKKG